MKIEVDFVNKFEILQTLADVSHANISRLPTSVNQIEIPFFMTKNYSWKLRLIFRKEVSLRNPEAMSQKILSVILTHLGLYQ